MSGFEIANTVVDEGERRELELRPAQLPSGGWLSMPLIVLHGSNPGPTMWVSAAIHGDEVGGVEIIHQVLGRLDPAQMSGTLLACPVVNVPGFAAGDRYFPDRRDLNRSFPGSPRGSLASRFAHALMTEVVSRCEVGVDLHTGSDHRSNYPQIRADLDDDLTLELARAFGAPLALHARVRDGSLREAAVRRGACTLLYEGGQAWRFEDHPIQVGVEGVLGVMGHLGIIDAPSSTSEPLLLRRSRWLRAPRSGVARILTELGETVSARQPIAVVSDAYGSTERVIRATQPSIVVARLEQPVVHRGDALVHLAPLAASAKGNDHAITDLPSTTSPRSDQSEPS